MDSSLSQLRKYKSYDNRPWRIDRTFKDVPFGVHNEKKSDVLIAQCLQNGCHLGSAILDFWISPNFRKILNFLLNYLPSWHLEKVINMEIWVLSI